MANRYTLVLLALVPLAAMACSGNDASDGDVGGGAGASGGGAPLCVEQTWLAEARKDPSSRVVVNNCLASESARSNMTYKEQYDCKINAGNTIDLGGQGVLLRGAAVIESASIQDLSFTHYSASGSGRLYIGRSECQEVVTPLADSGSFPVMNGQYFIQPGEQLCVNIDEGWVGLQSASGYLACNACEQTGRRDDRCPIPERGGRPPGSYAEECQAFWEKFGPQCPASKMHPEEALARCASADPPSCEKVRLEAYYCLNTTATTAACDPMGSVSFVSGECSEERAASSMCSPFGGVP